MKRNFNDIRKINPLFKNSIKYFIKVRLINFTSDFLLLTNNNNDNNNNYYYNDS